MMALLVAQRGITSCFLSDRFESAAVSWLIGIVC